MTNTKQGICDGNKILCLPPVGISSPIFPWIYASIWAARNQKLFVGRTFSESETLIKALLDAREWQEAQLNIEKHYQTRVPRNRQRARDPDCVSVFTNASWTKGTRDVGLGWTCHDSLNRQMGREAKGLKNIRSPLTAEAIEILEALLIVKNRGWQRTTVFFLTHKT